MSWDVWVRFIMCVKKHKSLHILVKSWVTRLEHPKDKKEKSQEHKGPSAKGAPTLDIVTCVWQLYKVCNRAGNIISPPICRPALWLVFPSIEFNLNQESWERVPLYNSSIGRFQSNQCKYAYNSWICMFRKKSDLLCTRQLTRRSFVLWSFVTSYVLPSECGHTGENQTDAASAVYSIYPAGHCGQAIWGHIWKHTMEKSCSQNGSHLNEAESETASCDTSSSAFIS